MSGRSIVLNTLFAVGLITATAGWCDHVVLDNGSQIVGDVTGIKDGKVTIVTDFAGELTIDFSRVTEMETSKQAFVGLKSGNRLLGTISLSAGKTTVATPDGVMSVNPAGLVALWHDGDVDPTAPPAPAPRTWSYEAALNLAGKTGNTEKIGYGGQVKATLKGDEDTLQFYARGKRAEENQTKTEDEIIGGMDFERRLKGAHSWYTRTELETDDIEGIDLRTTVGLGYGYYFIETPKHVFRSRLGLQYMHESYNDGHRTDDDPGLDVGIHHMIALWDVCRMTNDITYTPAFGDFGKYRLYHETAVDVPLAGSDAWKIRLGVSNEYNSESSPDIEKLDTTYFGRLVFSWQ